MEQDWSSIGIVSRVLRFGGYQRLRETVTVSPEITL